MIELIDVSKSYPIQNGVHPVLKNINFTIHKGEKIGILGRNGAGKSTLIKILSGAENPTSGQLRRDMKLSWPLAFDGGFQGSLTGIDNLKFLCRVYGVDYRQKIQFIEEFAEIGEYLREPVKNYSSGMRARLAFAISMAIDFDCYLIDEVLSVGDARFHDKCRVELFEKKKEKAMIIVSHELHNIREHCDVVAILDDGNLKIFKDLDEAFYIYNHLGMGQ
jgi:capsular polysaccharide transport system ATP-binding protein